MLCQHPFCSFSPIRLSLWSLQTFKTFLIPVVFCVSFDFVHSSYMFMLNGFSITSIATVQCLHDRLTFLRFHGPLFE